MQPLLDILFVLVQIVSFFMVQYLYYFICRYCYRQYHVDGKGRNGGSKHKGVPMTCTLQNGYNVTAQDLQDNLFPLRPALVPAKNIICHIKKYAYTFGNN